MHGNQRSTHSKIGPPAEWACVTLVVRAVELVGRGNAEPLLELGVVLALKVQAHAGLTEGIVGMGAQRAEDGAGAAWVGREDRLLVA